VLRMLLAFVIALLIAAASGAAAEPLAMAPAGNLFAPFNQILREPGAREDITADELRRQVIEYPSREPAGTIIVDTAHTFLYFVLGGGKALRYGIGVGREGFTWSGVEAISRMAEWPDWNPPKEMIGRQPYLPRFMAGGPGNPLGARALYLGDTDYRIHGTQRSRDHRPPRVERLHQAHQRGHHRSLPAGEDRRQGHRAVRG
jgi:lipoprotein-anchoring transpeptidase ErfK/SrfK